MDKKEQLALNRLTKKLTALRKTLRKDERDLLDIIVMGTAAGAAEVSGHAVMKPAFTLTLDSATYVVTVVATDATNAALV